MRNWLNKFQRCPGCGDFMIHLAIKNALKELNIAKENVVVVSGIGCSGKMSQYLDGYGAETLHGRALPFATGVKMSNEKLTVIGISGDGDAYGIGLGHFLHSCRRDVDLLYVVANNENYGLTTGQASPTTPLWIKTKSTPDGNTFQPFHPNVLAKSAGCRYSEQASSSDVKWLTQVLKDGILHKGFAHVDVAQACPSWKKW